MAAMLRRPPDWAALIGEAPECVDKEVGDGPTLEGGVRRVAMQAHRHANVDLGDRNHQRYGEEKQAVIEMGAQEKRHHVTGRDQYAVNGS
eukprot:scaffold51435_cov63-Attheya_sp.AAC.1